MGKALRQRVVGRKINATARNDDLGLRKSLRLACLGLAWLASIAFCGATSAAPPVPPPPRLCYEVLGEHPEIPEAEYLNVVKDSTHDYRFRQCAGEWYAVRHPESVKEFIKLLFDYPYIVQIAIDSLGRMGPSARPAVPFLISVLESDLKNYYSTSLGNALVSIGVVDRESIDKLLDMAITKHPNAILGDLAFDVLSRQKTLPAYIGDVVIAELDKDRDASRKFSDLYNILIPVRTPRAIERYVKLANEYVIEPNSLNIRPEFGRYKYEFQAIGTAAIPALVDNFRKHDDLDSRTFSAVTLMKMGTDESLQVGRQLAQEMLPSLREELAAVKSPVALGNDALCAVIGRIWQLGTAVKPLGKELLALLEHADEVPMRRHLIGTLENIKYTDALPTLRRLADKDLDAEVRSQAAKSLEALERVPENMESCHEVLGAHPEIPETKYFDIFKDRSRNNQLRVCIGEQYAMRHPESTKELLDLAITEYARDNGRLAIDVLSKQKTLPAYVGDVVIAELDKTEYCKFSDLYKLLIPVRTPRVIEWYVGRTKKCVATPGFPDYGLEFWRFEYVFRAIGAAAIPVLVDNFWKHDDLDSKTFSVVTLMVMGTPESIEAGKRLAQEMLPFLRKDLAAVKTLVAPDNNPLHVSINRIRRLGAIVHPFGNELLALLEQADEARMRLDLIWALRDIKYTDALPNLRRLANKDRDAEVRSEAAKSVEALENLFTIFSGSAA
ncbi:MAG: HEAT repeat domain-containing protein, partial [Candidatus Accumulibacter sp.]|nr:HEAT repeat domain-containing protein [Accumulibacter sp.]